MLHVGINIFNVIIVVFLLMSYFLLLVAIWGGNDAKRYPYMCIITMIITYLSGVVSYGLIGDGLLKVLWETLNGLALLILLLSFKSKKKSSLLADIVSFFLSVLFGCIPFVFFMEDNKKRMIFNFTIGKTDPFDLVLLGLMIVVAIWVFVIYTRYLREGRMTSTQLILLREEFRKIADRVSFEEPYSRFIREDLNEMINRIGLDLKNEIHNASNNKKRSQSYVPDRSDAILKEVRKINETIENEVHRADTFGVKEVVSDIKHSLLTPLSQIITNCEMLEKETSIDIKKQYLSRIENTVRVCQSIVNSYIEVSTVSKGNSFISIYDGISNYTMYAKEYSKEGIIVDYSSLPNEIEGYSSNVIIAILMPLLQNAIAAAPISDTIKIEFEEMETQFKIRIVNRCENEAPVIEDLNTTGYSSKENHTGIGLQTVRNLLRMTKGGELSFVVDNPIVTAIVILKKRKR